MSKRTRKVIAITNILSSDAVNVRLADNYDLESLIPQIVLKGGITNPLVVELYPDDKVMTLQGNRRLRSAQRILAGDYPDELKAALQKLECIVYSDLTDAERDALIFDDGETRPLNREETLLGVWRMYKQFKKSREIGNRMYYTLARYSGTEVMLNELPKDPQKREKRLVEWFRGTLDGYMLAAASMTEEVKLAMVLTARKEDGRLGEETTPFWATRKRITALSKARSEDEKAGGWTHEQGGEKYNALVQEYKDIDTGKATPTKAVKSLTSKELNERIGTFKSLALKAALGVAAGDESSGAALLTWDDKLHRQAIVEEIIGAAIPNVRDAHVKSLLHSLISSGPAADVELALKPFVG